jgi:hypothetical protein
MSTLTTDSGSGKEPPTAEQQEGAEAPPPNDAEGADEQPAMMKETVPPQDPPDDASDRSNSGEIRREASGEGELREKDTDTDCVRTGASPVNKKVVETTHLRSKVDDNTEDKAEDSTETNRTTHVDSEENEMNQTQGPARKEATRSASVEDGARRDSKGVKRKTLVVSTTSERAPPKKEEDKSNNMTMQSKSLPNSQASPSKKTRAPSMGSSARGSEDDGGNDDDYDSLDNNNKYEDEEEVDNRPPEEKYAVPMGTTHEERWEIIYRRLKKFSVSLILRILVSPNDHPESYTFDSSLCDLKRQSTAIA